MIEVSIIEFWPEDCKSLCLLSCGACDIIFKIGHCGGIQKIFWDISVFSVDK